MGAQDAGLVRLAGGARAFAVAVLMVPVLWSREPAALVTLTALAATWAVWQVLEARGTWGWLLVAVESLATGVVAGHSMQATLVVLAALAVPSFTAGLRLGVVGVATASTIVSVSTVSTGWLLADGLTDRQASEVATWCFAGLGIGLIATFVRATLRKAGDPLAPYLYAQDLFRQLLGLTGGLSSGLDPKTLGGAILDIVSDELPARSVALYVPRSDGLTPLVAKSVDADPDPSAADDIAERSWATGRPVTEGNEFAFPLLNDTKTVAVVAGCLSEQLDVRRLGLTDRHRRLTKRLGPSAVHLDTALLFDAFRDAATAEERRRLSREMHDGIAQEIASLGYLVDAIAAREESAEQRQRIELLRDRVTTIVAEVRRSVINLRTSIGENESLGTAIGSIARNLSQVSGIPIHVTLDERTTRLRPEVEAELFRITQEAINNAVRHAGASRIDVHCQVQPPSALVTVTDDGRGLQPGRPDSQGLQIMRERARLIDAELTIGNRPAGGVEVTVRLGDSPPAGSPGQDGSSTAAPGKHKVTA